MNKNFLCTKLEIKLILCLIFSFIISIVIFFLLQTIGESILDNHFNKISFIDNQKNQAISDFRIYISDNNLTINDHDEITKWVRKEKYVNLYIYKDNKLVYDFNRNNSTIGYGEHQESSIILPSKNLYDIAFTDTNAQMYMECFFEYKYYYIVSCLGIAISFLCFITIMLFLIKRKTTYIGMLESEIKILEGGNLTHEITINGNDELSSWLKALMR